MANRSVRERRELLDRMMQHAPAKPRTCGSRESGTSRSPQSQTSLKRPTAVARQNEAMAISQRVNRRPRNDVLGHKRHRDNAPYCLFQPRERTFAGYVARSANSANKRHRAKVESFFWTASIPVSDTNLAFCHSNNLPRVVCQCLTR
jgi:hypothetical protein